MLVALLLLTAAHSAVARAGMTLHGTSVLCIGEVAVTVYLAPNGAPADALAICADCIIGPLALAPAAPRLVAPVMAQTHVLTLPLDQLAPPPVRTSSARAPPLDAFSIPPTDRNLPI
ncbi:MAG: hypothetical protein AAGA70_08290 [Pseudomonadota bacterium]